MTPAKVYVDEGKHGFVAKLEYAKMFLAWARRKPQVLFATDRLFITTRYREEDEKYDIRHSYTGDVIGTITKWGGPDLTQYGYRIDPDERGKGYMTEALFGLVQHRLALGLPVRDLYIEEDNHPSLACARKVGWIQVGTHYNEKVFCYPTEKELKIPPYATPL